MSIPLLKPGLPSANNATHLTGQKKISRKSNAINKKNILFPGVMSFCACIEAVQEIVPHLNEHDHKRFSKGLARVFIDNYAAIPSESIRRLLALREAGIIHILALGEDYKMEINGSRTYSKRKTTATGLTFLSMPAGSVRLK
ncbi:hypothetical protein ACLK15_09780 [Escherichia coli]